MMNKSTIYKFGLLPSWYGIFEFHRQNNRKCASLNSSIIFNQDILKVENPKNNEWNEPLNQIKKDSIKLNRLKTYSSMLSYSKVLPLTLLFGIYALL